MLLGLARSLGRSSDESMSLISYLLSVHGVPHAHSHTQQEPTPEPSEPASVSQKGNFNTFRSILPRTLSSVFVQADAGTQVIDAADGCVVGVDRKYSYRER